MSAGRGSRCRVTVCIKYRGVGACKIEETLPLSLHVYIIYYANTYRYNVMLRHIIVHVHTLAACKATKRIFAKPRSTMCQHDDVRQGCSSITSSRFNAKLQQPSHKLKRLSIKQNFYQRKARAISLADTVVVAAMLYGRSLTKPDSSVCQAFLHAWITSSNVSIHKPCGCPDERITFGNMRLSFRSQ